MQITAGGAAHKTGKLRMGDRILMVNGVDMSGATHQEAVMALLNPPNEITLTVRHDPQPKGLKVTPFVFWQICIVCVWCVECDSALLVRAFVWC